MNMGAIAALIIVSVFGTVLLVYFHYEDKHENQIGISE